MRTTTTHFDFIDTPRVNDIAVVTMSNEPRFDIDPINFNIDNDIEPTRNCGVLGGET